MTTATTAVGTGATNPPGLLARLIGVVVSPRDAYTAVAAQPKWFGALAFCVIVVAAAQAGFMSTDLGQEIALDQQVRAMESFGIQVSDQQYAQMESQMAYAPYTTGGSILVLAPLFNALIGGLIVVVFSMLLGGAATFRQVYAAIAHSGVITVVQTVFSVALSYALGQVASANLALFVPTLEEGSFVTLFLGAIDLFLVWWAVNLAIGIGVLYKRKTGPIATLFLGLYVVIALILAVVRS